MKKTLLLLITFLLAITIYAQSDGNSKKLIVNKFANETPYGKGFFYDAENDILGKTAFAAFVSGLTESGIYVTEQDNATHAVYGAVTEYAIDESGKQGIYYSAKNHKIKVAADIRIVEISSGNEIFSDNVECIYEFENEQFMTYDASAYTQDYYHLCESAFLYAFSTIMNDIVKTLR